MDVVNRTRLILLALAAMTVIAFGRVHIAVHGGRLGVALCAKDGWSMRDTFVNVDDYIKEQPLRLRPEKQKQKVAIALLRCNAAPSRQDERDLYWQVLHLTIVELHLRAQLQWVVTTYAIVGSEDACSRLKPLAISLAPPGQPTTCDDDATGRQLWTIVR
jgi:hypothetical protein